MTGCTDSSKSLGGQRHASLLSVQLRWPRHNSKWRDRMEQLDDPLAFMLDSLGIAPEASIHGPTHYVKKATAFRNGPRIDDELDLRASSGQIEDVNHSRNEQQQTYATTTHNPQNLV